MSTSHSSTAISLISGTERPALLTIESMHIGLRASAMWTCFDLGTRTICIQIHANEYSASHRSGTIVVSDMLDSTCDNKWLESNLNGSSELFSLYRIFSAQ